MIITIDTEKIAKSLIADGEWTLEDFEGNDAPQGWTNELVDTVPEYEDAVYADVKRLLREQEEDKMQQGKITPELETFIAHRDEVMIFIRKQMIEQNVSKLDASMTVEAVKMFKPSDVENLYKCIKSDLDEKVIKSIVAHDFNGLHNNDPYFLPKSSQFGEKKYGEFK